MFKRIRQLAQLVSFREIRNAVLGLSVVFGGLALALLTLYAHRTGNIRLAGLAATASLVFVVLIVIFVIPPLARSASTEASQMNLPFEFTAGGAIVIGLTVIVAFAAWNTGNNLLFLVLSFVTSALFVSFFVGNVCLRKLDVKMRFPETIFAGEKTPILVGLSNRKRMLPTYSITAEVRGKERKYSKFISEFEKIVSKKWAKRLARAPIIKHTLDYFVFVPRSKSIENKVEHVFKKRGRFIIQDFELSTRFPFGFFRHRRRLPAQKAEIIVFPKPQEIMAEILDLPLDAGRLVSPKRGSGQDLFGLRDYQPTDDYRHIDWKATAKADRLTVREFTAEDERQITVIFDPYVSLTKSDTKKTLRQKVGEEQKGAVLSKTESRFEKGVCRAASLLTHFGSEQADIRLFVGDAVCNFGAGREHLNQTLKTLALLEPISKDRSHDAYLEGIFRDIISDSLSSHVFFVTTLTPTHIPGEILKRVNIAAY